jgi:hypothetical protein
MLTSERATDTLLGLETSRVGLYVDLENVVHDFMEAHDEEQALLLLTSLVHACRSLGVVISAVAVGNVRLARSLAFHLDEHGVRTFTHKGGPDAADLVLLPQIEAACATSAEIVVIASGDAIFANVARRLSGQGKQVIVVGRRGTVAKVLQEAASEVLEVTTLDEGLDELREGCRCA